jgi:hypothetical protein
MLKDLMFAKFEWGTLLQTMLSFKRSGRQKRLAGKLRENFGFKLKGKA